MIVIKFQPCDQHEIRTWRPVGQPCPACHPEFYGPMPGGHQATVGLVTVDDNRNSHRAFYQLEGAARMALELLEGITQAKVQEIILVKKALREALADTSQESPRVVASYPVKQIPASWLADPEKVEL